MPDITMCKGDKCPIKEKCYRYTAEPDEWQSYFTESPIKNGKCDFYDNRIYNQLKNIVEGKE